MVLPSSNSIVRARAADVEPDRLAGGDDLGAEPLGLPAGRRGAARRRRRRWGSRGSSRSANCGPACPPVVVLLDQHGLQALGRAVHGGGQAGGPAADDGEVVHLQRRGWWTGPSMAASSALVGSTSVSPCSVITTGSRRPSRPAGIEQLLALGLVGHERAEGVLVAGQELAHLPRPGDSTGGRSPWCAGSRGRRWRARPRAARRSPGRASPRADPTA